MSQPIECAIVCMPFASILQPPLGVSVLCGTLRNAGIGVKALYPSIYFAERIPYSIYEWLGGNIYERVADYFFSRIAFGRDADCDISFHEMIDSLRDRRRMPSFISGHSDLAAMLRIIEKTCEGVIEKVINQLKKLPRLKVVSCSATFVQLYASLALLKVVKQEMPQLITMLGGAECEGVAAIELVRKLSFLDYAFSGEGDCGFTTVVTHVLRNNHNHRFILPNGAYNKEKAVVGIVEHPMASPFEFGNIDHSDYLEAVRKSRRFRMIQPTRTIEFSRGCWKGMSSQCRFCGFNGERMRFRQKPEERILSELGKMYVEGARFFQATDTVLDLHVMRRPLEIFSKHCRDAVITCDAVSTMSESQLSFLAHSGVLFLQVGIETLHPKHVKLLNKGNSAVGSIAFLKFARENSITIFWNILTSIPGDTASDYDEMRNIVKSLEHLYPPNFGVIRFDRFSDYWRHPDTYGLKLVPARNCQYLIPSGSGLDRQCITMVFDNLNESVRTDYRDKSIVQFEETLRNWRTRYHANKPILYLRAKNEVVDTRSVAMERSYQLSTEEYEILRFLRIPRSKCELDDSVYEKWQKTLQPLLDRQFVLEWDGKFISLILEKINLPSEGRRRVIANRINLSRQITRTRGKTL